MKPRLSWRTAFKIGWRDLKASPGKFLFIAFAVAAGVGALTGVRSFADAFRAMLLSEARTLMAADLMVRTFEEPAPEHEAVLARIRARGAEVTSITETVSMLAAGGERPPVLVSLKAVDPQLYPFYGEVKLDPPVPLRQALRPDAIAVSDDLLLRLDLKTGETVRLGEESFRIVGVVTREPDRMTGSLNVGPRIMMSREALERTGLIRTGSRASHRYLVRLPQQGLPVGEARQILQDVFLTALISDFRETHPRLTRGLGRAERYLSLVSLLAMIVGALGVAATIHAHLQHRLDTIAIMKCLGGRSGQIMRIFVSQAVCVTVLGGLAGIALGALVQVVFPFLLARYFPLTPRFLWDWQSAVEGISIALLTALLFTVPAVLGVKRVRPAQIFRRDVAEQAEPKRPWRGGPERWAAESLLILAIAGIAGWLAGRNPTEATRVGSYFAAGLTVALVVLSGISRFLLAGLRWGLRRSAGKLPAAVRQGIANIYRPGNQAQAVLVSLGVGVMFTLSVFLIQRGLLAQLLASAPPDTPNVFLLNITGRERDGLVELLRTHPAVEGGAELIPATAARLETIDGRPLDHAKMTGRLRRFAQARAVTWAEKPHERWDLLAGEWWNQAPGQVCAQDDAARDLGLKPGMRLTWSAGARTLTATLKCVYRSEEVRMGGNMDFVFSPGTLDGLPMQYFAAARMKPREVASFQKASFSRFPTVTVINGADVMEILQQVVDQIAMVVRFISLFAILAGVVILASSVAGTRFRRIREVAILKTLGATRKKVIAIFSVEFVVLGAVAGLMGTLLASGFSNLLLVQLLDGKARFDVVACGVAIVTAALIATAAGWLASWRILGQKPLEVLRGE